MNKDKEVEAYKSGNLTPEEQTKYEIAQELGILDKVFGVLCICQFFHRSADRIMKNCFKKGKRCKFIICICHLAYSFLNKRSCFC